jgi:4-hydroxybenzoate polyprenyltransferase
MDARAILGLVRPFTMLAPVTGVLCAAGAASARLGIPYDVASVSLATGAALLANAASNAWNQAFDAEIDRVNKPARPIPSGRATVRGAMVLGHVAALAGVAIATLHAARAGHAWFLACLVVGVAATWIYSAPPLRTKRRTYGALLTIALPRGFLVPVAGWAVVAPPATAEPWALGVVPGLFVLGAATTKDFADVDGDRAGGCRTLPVVLGARRAARLTAPFLALPFLLYVAFSALGILARPLAAWIVLAVALASLGAFTARLLVSAPERLATERNHPAWRAMYLLMLANQIGVLLVYALA